MKDALVCFAIAIIYISWLIFLMWLIKYFDSAMPLWLLIVSPNVKYGSSNGEAQEGEG